ncbi:LPS export ABC transporter periplasmic protein LptC [Tardibacter chloracetimidivorans]|uniref:LPS export ABC transporter periplasmic protein LptC n=1 Tax=Tardibacter chloracetimidivorans TaxID=1921510 RepID=A0A1L3ZUZ6_9SPHN|nr:LPS export ABC transporter periplasmic protein LptC [Tardibacter chloracetimidivorans]API59437.1 LPS export ABC transporter periplasmic protein LptC [Tardibacter chloracetimidivorans]
MATRPARELTARQQSALPGTGYHKMVGTAKWLLPTLAGVVGVAMLAWPVMGGHDFSFVLAKDRVAIASERLKIAQAVYRGEDRRGQPFVISAGSAVQQTSRDPVVKLQDMAARIQMRDGPAHIVAKSGLYDMESETVDVDGPVAVRAAGGYALNTRDVQIDLASRTAHSEGPVTGSMPLGTFSADRIAADIGERTVTLEGRARLHIVQNKVR